MITAILVPVGGVQSQHPLSSLTHVWVLAGLSPRKRNLFLKPCSPKTLGDMPLGDVQGNLLEVKEEKIKISIYIS